MPVCHECQRCTACCHWSGQVRLTDAEIARLAEFLELGEPQFVQRFTRLTADRRGLALLEKPSGDCVFLVGNDCSIQSVKPQPCRDFPNLWRHPEGENQCRAIPHIFGDEEYVQRVAQVTGRSAESVRELLRHAFCSTAPERKWLVRTIANWRIGIINQA